MADQTAAPSRATLYPIERALVNTAVAIVTCTSHNARILLISRLARILQQFPDEPTGERMSPAEVVAIQQANDIKSGRLHVSRMRLRSCCGFSGEMQRGPRRICVTHCMHCSLA